VPRSPRSRRALDLNRDRVVLLFFEDFDQDRFVRGDRHALRFARRLVQAARRKQKVTGFGVAFQSLITALEQSGYDVRVNDERLARANPDYPVGIAGYPHILDRWDLPNPAVLGPGLLDHPSINPGLMKDPRFVRYIVPCEWMRTMFGKVFPPEKLGLFFAGLDMRQWGDLRSCPKDLDFIVYDKIRWNHAQQERELVGPVLRVLEDKGLRYERLVYKQYDHARYRSLLQRAHGMIFICEHETQGLAYQEAMSSNVPILAWDPRLWLDPNRFKYGETDVPASSVPYFDERCGDRFRDAAELPGALQRFMAHRDGYEPRRYVADHLSLEASARAYLDLYRQALASRDTPRR
jgi:hypothetical protein